MENITPDGLTVRLVNLDPIESRSVVVQAGAYSEHQFNSVRYAGKQIAVDGTSFTVDLAPGAGEVLEVGMELLANRPKLGMPW